MSMMDALQQRRTYYNINKELPVSIEEVRSLVDRLTELVPDAFNMKSSRIVTVSGSRQDALWDAIYDVFEGKVAREKIDSFRAGAGTILYFYDRSIVAAMQEQPFQRYAAACDLEQLARAWHRRVAAALQSCHRRARARIVRSA